MARPGRHCMSAVRHTDRGHRAGGRGRARCLHELPHMPAGMSCPNCGNLMTSYGNGVWKCLNCGYTSV